MEDGGPAFPRSDVTVCDSEPVSEYTLKGNHGMSLRDWFATTALPEFIRIANDSGSHDSDNQQLSKWAAEMAYLTADAMLKARELK